MWLLSPSTPDSREIKSFPGTKPYLVPNSKTKIGSLFCVHLYASVLCKVVKTDIVECMLFAFPETTLSFTRGSALLHWVHVLVQGSPSSHLPAFPPGVTT